jgi:hypothetical protein
MDGWKAMYVSGAWSLGRFEAHVEAMLPTIPDEWYLPERERSERGAEATTQTYREAVATWLPIVECAGRSVRLTG